MGLKKNLSIIGIYSIGVGAMISSGLFILPSVAYQESSTGLIIAYFFAGILMFPALFSSLELSTAIPRAGGTYFYIERILGSGAGMVAGFANWFSIALKSALALAGIGVFASVIYPDLTVMHFKIVSVFACLLFTILNLKSIKSSVKVQVVLVAMLLMILIQYVLIAYRTSDLTYLKDIMNSDFKNIFSTTGMVFISYGGITKIASISEEVKNPGKSLVKGIYLAFFTVQLLYLVVIVLITGLLPPEIFKSSYLPLTEASKYMSRNTVVVDVQIVLTAIGGILAFITTANAGLMSASRVPLAMSRDSLLPGVFSKLSKSGSPVISILLTSLFMISSILFLDIKNLAKVASVFMLMLFLMMNLSVIIIRISRISNYKPSFISPLFPLMQVAGIIFYFLLIIAMGILPIAISLVFILFSLVWYFIYAKNRVKRKSAFVHMIEKLVDPDLHYESSKLEDELLDILIERDDIEEDRFDKIIRNSIVLDIEQEINRSMLFNLVSEAAGKRLGIKASQIEKKLNVREDQASTLLYPGVAVPHAIPHVVIEGQNIFDIVLVRSKKGILWNEKGDTVYTAFCLIGSEDERNFHLRSLMAIAQILQDPKFHSEWINAKNPNELKSVILLSKRRRK